MKKRAGDFPFSSPSAPTQSPSPSSEGLFFWGGWREAVFRLVGVDLARRLDNLSSEGRIALYGLVWGSWGDWRTWASWARVNGSERVPGFMSIVRDVALDAWIACRASGTM